MKKASIAILLLLSILTTVQGEGLKTPPFLGLVANNNETGDMVVQRVLPGATADELGLKEGDEIVSFNQQPIENFQQIISFVQQSEVGTTLNVRLKRGDEIIELKGALQGRAKESHDAYEVVYDVVNHKNNKLRSIVYRPLGMKHGEKRPAMYYIQGYTCQSIDHAMFPEATMQQLLNAVVQSGMVVYKIEKFGVGDSQGELRCEDVDFTTEMAGFEAGLNALKGYDFVDDSKVFIFGHSLGGVYAPLLAKTHELAGVAVYGAVFKPWYDYMLDIFAVQSLMFGTSQAEAKANTDTVQPLLAAWLKTEQDWQNMMAAPALQSAINSNLLPIQGEQILHRHYTFFRDLNRYDLQQAWQQSQQPVLAIHGEFDIQAISSDWAKDLGATINAQNKTQATVKIMPNTDHGLMRYPSMQALQSDMGTGAYRPGSPGTHYNPAVAEVLIDWMQKIGKQK